MTHQRVAHNVFFTLIDASPEKIEELVQACRKYLNVQPGIVFFAAGPIGADFHREVNDRDWQVGLHLVFVDKEAHDNYQQEANHQKFIEENKANWARVRVFDSYVA